MRLLCNGIIFIPGPDDVINKKIAFWPKTVYNPLDRLQNKAEKLVKLIISNMNMNHRLHN